ncbi:PPR42-like protein, partial [Mya arenaria]
MVKLTIDLIARGTSGYTKKKRDETMNHYLKRLTHLYLENKCIDEVGEDMSMCRNLSVLYLYDNQLTSIPALHHNQFLTMLYLQNNHISRVEGLQHLHRLTKLYLGGNSITVVEGLEKLEKLQELHLENQSLPPGEKLLFDPHTLDGKQISETAKQFLKNWHANKETQKQKRMEVLRRGETFLDDYRGLPRKQFDELLARTATLADQGFQRSAPVKARSGLLRSNFDAR